MEVYIPNQLVYIFKKPNHHPPKKNNKKSPKPPKQTKPTKTTKKTKKTLMKIQVLTFLM